MTVMATTMTMARNQNWTKDARLSSFRINQDSISISKNAKTIYGYIWTCMGLKSLPARYNARNTYKCDCNHV
jgi:hypothetical protein